MGGAVVANLPQVALSIAYLAYNGLFTRMLGEWEWSLLSVRYQGLRVSRPKGRQRSSYRLQLPYRWSIPLMATSGLLHWLVSNCIFVSLYVSKSISPLRPVNSLFPVRLGSSLFAFSSSRPGIVSFREVELTTTRLSSRS